MRKTSVLALVGGFVGLAGLAAWTTSSARISGSLAEAGTQLAAGPVAEGLILPEFDSSLGRNLFASKGCVVCHSINGVGGEDAPPLDAATMPLPMNPFDFVANMWRGADAMIFMQREELGDQIELTGDDLAAIIAFVHDEDEQRKFTMESVPETIRDLLLHMDDESLDHEEHEEGEHDSP